MNGGKGTAVDVICEHKSDGTLIPLRVRIIADSADIQMYTIKEYKDISHQGTRTLPNGVYVTDNTLVFECVVNVFGRKQTIWLYYGANDTIWKMTA